MTAPSEPGDALGRLFARLRDAVDREPEPDRSGEQEPVGLPVVPSPVASPVSTDEPAGGEPELVVAVDLVPVEAVEPEPRWPVFAVAESATLDDAGLRRRRDAVVTKAATALLPRLKRLLQDEQNEVLDALRRQRGRGDPRAVLPSVDAQRSRWSTAVADVIDECYAAGRVLGGGRTRPAPTGLCTALVALLVDPLRERVDGSITACLREGPYDGAAELQQAISRALGARYREWRTQELRSAVEDLAAWAFARGVFDATPDGVVLRWVPAEVEQCPDADDNALEPTERGRPFPTGQACPPAHPGCRCLVVPADGGGATAGR